MRVTQIPLILLVGKARMHAPQRKSSCQQWTDLLERRIHFQRCHQRRRSLQPHTLNSSAPWRVCDWRRTQLQQLLGAVRFTQQQHGVETCK